MAKQSLFAILSRSPWWLSIIVAAVLFAVMRLLLPDLIAISVALPFVAIGGYAGWRQLRAPSATKVADALNLLRAMSWEEFSTLIEEAFRQEGYTVAKLTADDVDYEMSRNERVAVVCCKRWKVARTGVAPVRDLFEAGQARNAHEYIYVVAGEFTANAREFAAEKSIRLLNGAELVQLVTRVARGRKKWLSP
jgi:restriction system protein